jgi:glycosyltransferase involved in cell wall biosynthesis
VFCSTIIPTIARPTLGRAVNSVLSQEFGEAPFEVIVVNDSGRRLTAEPWQTDPRVHIVETQRRGVCFARNAGAAIAAGRYLHFLDDDDYLLPGALASFWRLSLHTQAAWLYGVARLVNRDGSPRALMHPEGVQGNVLLRAMAGEWFAVQAALIDAGTYFAVGGFDNGIPGAEDRQILYDVARCSDVASTDAVVTVIQVGAVGGSYEPARMRRFGLYAREAALNAPGVFERLRASANSSYWRGHLGRLYLGSTYWNCQHGRFFTSASRLTYALHSLFGAPAEIFKTDFWHGLRRSHKTPISRF